MGKKKKAPPPPDYNALAIQQAALSKAAANEQTIADRPNQITPWGSTTWQNQNGNWTQTQTLNPMDQAQLDKGRALEGQQLDIAGGLMGRARDAMGNPLDYSSATPMTGYDMSKVYQQAPTGDYEMDAWQNGAYNPGGYQTGGFEGGPWQQKAFGDQNMDVGQMNAGFEGNKEYEDAIMSRMGPDLQKRRNAEIQRLRNQGIYEGSEAFNNADQRQSRTENDAQMQAVLAGADEHAKGFSRQLAQRGQNVGIAGQNTAQELAQRAAGLGEAQFNTGLEDRRRAAGLGEASYNSGLEQNQRQMEMAQRAQNMDQRNQNMAIGDQQFAQQGAMAGLSGQQRQQQIAELTALRNSPMQDYQQFTQGTDVTNPQMPSFMGGTGYNAADIYGAGKDTYQAQVDAVNAKNAQTAGITKGLMGMGGSWLGAGMPTSFNAGKR